MKRSLYWIISLVGAIAALAVVLLGLRPAEKAAARELPVLVPNLATSATPSASEPSLGWRAEEVAHGKSIYQASLKVDAAGHVHMAYGDDRLYYAYFDGSGWQHQVADREGGRYASLALDVHQQPHISYQTKTGQLRFASWTGSQWQIEIIDTTPNDAYNCATSLAFDSGGNPHIAYRDNGIAYARWTGSNWITETVDGDAISLGGGELSLALDSAGNPFMVYIYDLYHIGFARRYGGTWEVKDITPPNSASYGVSLAFDAAGVLHVSYVLAPFNSDPDTLYYLTWNGVGWDEEQVVSQDHFLNPSPTIALDASGMPHFVYEDASNQLHYVHRSDAGWSDEVFGVRMEMVSCAGSLSLALDSSGNPHVGYCDLDVATIRTKAIYTHKTAAGWISQEIDKSRPIGYSNALVLASDQLPRAAFFVDGQPFYARWTGTVWEQQPIPSQPVQNASAGIALVLDPGNRPHLAYPTTDTGIQYVFWNGTQWLSETIPSFIAYNLDLALDPQGSPYLCGVDGDSSAVYAHKAAGGWIVQALATAAASPCSLAVDTTGVPHVAYVGLDNHLEYARWNGTAWLPQTVDTNADSYFEIALQLGPENTPQIVYSIDDRHQGVASRVMHASWDGSAWQVAAMSEPLNDVRWIRFALNPSGEPSVLYRDLITGGSIYLAHQNGRGWQNLQLEQLGGQHQDYEPFAYSLAVDALNRPHLLSGLCNNTSICYEGQLTHRVVVGADFSADALEGYTPLAITFTNQSFGDFTAFHWNFGDGATSSEENPTHLYTSPGVYTPTLTVSGPDGTYTMTRPGSITASILTDFSADATQGYTPMTVTFTNLSIGDFTSSLWDFGDGITSSLPAPTHTYTAQGQYTVTLTVTGPSGSYQNVKPAYITALQTVETILVPGQAGVLSYTTLAGLVTQLEFPPDAVSQTTRMLYRPLFGVTYPLTAELAYAGQAFDLDAALLDPYTPLAQLNFTSSVTVTMQLRNAYYEESYALHSWDGHNWQEAACGSYQRNLTEKWIALPICHTGRFALVYKPVRIYVPVVMTQSQVP